MVKRLYMGKLFSNRREKLVDMCIKLQNSGKGFLYIMPSSAAISQVRESFRRLNKGFLGSRVIVFDDLEMSIVKGHIEESQIIYEPLDRVIISNLCRELKESLRIYGGVYGKRGFHQEIAGFIRTLKRECIDETRLEEIQGRLREDVLRDKLHDLSLIYRHYCDLLRERDIYDRNDVSLRAIELAASWRELEHIDTIIIDGFTDFEAINLRLMEEIASTDKVNIIVNCPFENSLTKGFLENEILSPLISMGFEEAGEEEDEYEVNPGIKELSNKLYSGERLLGENPPITLIKYPSIETEVRETARMIKGRLMEGNKPNEIAVYISSREAYSDSLSSIFREFEIHLSMGLEIPLGSSELVRRILKGFKDREVDALTAGEWVSLLGEELEGRREYMEELSQRALNDEASFSDKLELKALEALAGIKESTRISFERSGIAGDIFSREYFVEYMLEVMSTASIKLEDGNIKGVRVMDTSLAKGVYFNHVYILGLNEGELPVVSKSTGLFDSFEVEELIEAGLRYGDFLRELTRDKIRFNLSLSSARESLTLSYRGSDEDGRFAIASPFIDEVKFLANKKEDRSLSMRDRFEIDYNTTMSIKEAQRSAIRKSFEKRYNGLRGSETYDLPEDNTLQEVMKKGKIEFHREREPFFNEYEGIIGSDFDEISELIGKFSPSALGEYIKCPFKYMVTNLLKPGEEEKDEGELTPMEIGDLYHRVLFSYYSNVRQFEVLDEGLFKDVFEEAFTALRRLEASDDDLERLRDECFKRIWEFVTLDLERFRKYREETGGRELRPYILEGFIDASEIFGIKMYCKIDRVDLEYELKEDRYVPTGRYVVYDYKKNSLKNLESALKNEDYQLPIYFLAVENHLKRSIGDVKLECMALLYLSIEATEKKNRERKGKKIELDGIYKSEYKKALSIDKRGEIAGSAFIPLMESLRVEIQDTINSIKSGKFNYRPLCSVFEDSSSSSCEYSGFCRYSKAKVRSMA